MREEESEVGKRILHQELTHIMDSASAILEQGSSQFDELYLIYSREIEDDVLHNQNLGHLTLGEIDKLSVREREIPTFEQFIVKRLTTHGYSQDRLSQILLNCRSCFEETEGQNVEYNKFVRDLTAICSSSRTIAQHIENDDLNLARDEFESLRNRYALYFPNFSNPLEMKPGLFGFSIDLMTLFENKKWMIRKWKILRKSITSLGKGRS